MSTAAQVVVPWVSPMIDSSFDIRGFVISSLYLLVTF